MPRRKGALFLPLDVHFMDDDRIIEAGEKASWLYLAMCLASKRLGSDGMLTARQIDRLHVPGWERRLVPLVRLELVVDLGAELWGIRAWLSHNDPQRKIEENREKDRVRKKDGVPSGIRPESVPSRDVERSREEKREVGPRPESGPTDCDHGVDRNASCRQCPSSLRAVTG